MPRLIVDVNRETLCVAAMVGDDEVARQVLNMTVDMPQTELELICASVRDMWQSVPHLRDMCVVAEREMAFQGGARTLLRDELVARLQEELEVCCQAISHAEAHALSELHFGAAARCDSILYVVVDERVDGAFATRAGLLRGSHGHALSLAHMSCEDAQYVQCSCGAMGHLEPVATISGILSRYFELGGERQTRDGRAVDLAHLNWLASKEDELATWALQRSGHAVGEMLAGTIAVLDPAIIVLQGRVCELSDAWQEAVLRGVRDTAPLALADVAIVPAKFIGANYLDATLLGAKLC